MNSNKEKMMPCLIFPNYPIFNAAVKANPVIPSATLGEKESNRQLDLGDH
jgi:hypothetical protein